MYSVCAVADNKSVGIARVIGDGSIYFYIQDFIVQKEFQGKGIGSAIMKKIMEFLKQYAPEGSFIGLMSAKGKEGFYLKYGFIERPNDIYGAGMGFYKLVK
ncbi:GNAT family N-acetyltransferase [Desulfotruncus arcticus]|nr:GNAT family N-acetyltransferase [Desulfotruncus arcticus]